MPASMMIADKASDLIRGKAPPQPIILRWRLDVRAGIGAPACIQQR